MPNYHDTLVKKIKRLISAILWQCLWLIPLCVFVWYGKKQIGPWCRDYFGIGEAQKLADYFTLQVNQTASPVIWNLGTISLHLKALFLSTTATAKLNSLIAVSDLITRLVSLMLNLIQIGGGIYALVRVKRAYFAQKNTDRISNTICREIMPEIETLRTEIRYLRDLLEKQSHES